MNHKKVFVIILLLGFILRLISAATIPIFEKPDEHAHFDYIDYVAENHRLPVQKEGDFGAEFFQPPFYQVMISPLHIIFSSIDSNIEHQVYFLRLISILISMITLFVIYKIAAFIFGKNEIALGALAFAALLPSHINMNSNVTNSNFGDLIATIIIYKLLVLLEEKKPGKVHKLQKTKAAFNQTILLGVIAGIAVITRFSVIPALLSVPFAYAIKEYPNLKRTIKPLLAIVGIALLISSWSFVRNMNLYGDPLGLNAVHLSSPRDDIDVNTGFIGRLLGWTFITFWASYGKTNGVFIGNLSSLLGIAVFAISYLLLLLFSLWPVYGVARNFKTILKNDRSKMLLLLSIHLCILAILFISFSLRDFQPQGRLFFPAMSSIAIFFTYGIHNMFPKRYEKNFLQIYVAMLIAINLAAIASSIANFY